MNTHLGARVTSSTSGSPTPGLEERSGGYFFQGDTKWSPNDPRYRDEKLIGRNPGSPGPGSRKPKVPPAPPRLGPTQLAVLTELAGTQLTAPEVADRLGRVRRSVHGIFDSLEAKGYIARVRKRPGKGTSVTVWGATTTGRNVLAAHQKGSQS